MMKILYVVSTLKRSGPVIVLSNIIKYLDKNRFEPIVLTLSPEPKESMKKYFENDLNTKVETLGLGRVQSLFVAKKRIRKFLSENSIDIVHTHGFRADALISKINGIPKVSTLHNYPFYDYPMTYGKVKGYLMAKIHLKYIRNNPKNFIACSKSITQEFKQNNIELQYIQNGIDTQMFFPIDIKQKQLLRKQLGIQNDDKIFISIGSLISRKDMGTIIEAFKKNDDPDSFLIIAGDGIERENLQKKSSNNIIFLGNISNVNEYLQASDCFVSASLAEGLPNTVLEAMACGLPTILSDIPSHIELYDDEKGIFFKTKDVDSLVNLFKKVSNDFKFQKELSLKLVNEKFNAKTMSEKYQKLYEEKINDKI
jgi:glycosyltransferase involved in cell wall biosynthesis